MEYLIGYILTTIGYVSFIKSKEYFFMAIPFVIGSCLYLMKFCDWFFSIPIIYNMFNKFAEIFVNTLYAF